MDKKTDRTYYCGECGEEIIRIKDWNELPDHIKCKCGNDEYPHYNSAWKNNETGRFGIFNLEFITFGENREDSEE